MRHGELAYRANVEATPEYARPLGDHDGRETADGGVLARFEFTL